MSEPTNSRVQTRPGNTDQHPGNVVTKRKRRTQAEMKEVRRVEDQEKEELKKLRAEKVCDLAALEDKISKKDSREAAGTRTFVRPKPRLLKKKVVFS
jgi:hypothetical protein